jgi:5'-3' exonuclease
MQLLCVLPKKSAKLLPSPLDELIKSYDITIDLSGKNKEWEGIVLGLEEIDFGLLEKQYCTALKQISEIDKKRNCVRKYRVFEN